MATYANLIAADPTPDQIIERRRLEATIANYRTEAMKLINERRELRMKFDAAQTFGGNENHWAQADHLDPHNVASLAIRRKLRSRSRYEVIENNPYLKGTILSICNDFVGNFPSLIITDEGISDKKKERIQERWNEWAAICNLRRKLWRMRMAKIVDGESFMIPYRNVNRYDKYDVDLDFHVIECDRVSSYEESNPALNNGIGEIDGVRFDAYENPIAYHILYRHPGGSTTSYPFSELLKDQHSGTWVPAKFVIHWFRQDRGWLRGIPETTPSLPLCALLRRYTLSIVRHAEIVSDITVLLETQNPASQEPFSSSNPIDNPFEAFPIEMGLMMNLPMGYQMKQLEPVPLGTQYDEFVGSILREITRPILAPYHIAAGTSKDSNMASAVVDQNIYKGGQEAERYDCESAILDRMLTLWWNEATLLPNYLDQPQIIRPDKPYAKRPPKHEWQWTKIGLDHTDPSKVATALETLHNKGFMLDADIQKLYYGRDYKSWQKQVLLENEFRQKLKPMNPEDNPENMPKPATPPGGASRNGAPKSASNGSAR